MKKKDLVELFLRSPSIKVLIADEHVFADIVVQIVSVVKHRYNYDDFKVINGMLRSPYLQDQFIKYMKRVDVEEYAGYCADKVIVVNSSRIGADAMVCITSNYTLVNLED